MSERQVEQHLSSLAPAEAGESVAGPAPAAPARADETGQGAHEPGVDGDPFACSRCFNRGLQSLRQAQRDPSHELNVARRGGRSLVLLLLDVNKRRVLPREADLDVSGRQLLRYLERGLGEGVEQAQAGGGADG
jgi:hypothetical protein